MAFVFFFQSFSSLLFFFSQVMKHAHCVVVGIVQMKLDSPTRKP